MFTYISTGEIGSSLSFIKNNLRRKLELSFVGLISSSQF